MKFCYVLSTKNMEKNLRSKWLSVTIMHKDSNFPKPRTTFDLQYRCIDQTDPVPSKIMDFQPDWKLDINNQKHILFVSFISKLETLQTTNKSETMSDCWFQPQFTNILVNGNHHPKKNVDHKMDLTPARCVFWVRKLRNPTGTPLFQRAAWGARRLADSGCCRPISLSVASTGQILDVHEFMNCNMGMGQNPET